jgi:hypothetical protein
VAKNLGHCSFGFGDSGHCPLKRASTHGREEFLLLVATVVSRGWWKLAEVA